MFLTRATAITVHRL